MGGKAEIVPLLVWWLMFGFEFFLLALLVYWLIAYEIRTFCTNMLMYGTTNLISTSSDFLSKLTCTSMKMSLLADCSRATFTGLVNILWHMKEKNRAHRATGDHLATPTLNLLEENNFNEVQNFIGVGQKILS